MKTILIAEVGLNHLGDDKLAREYFDALGRLSIDAISIQVREPEFYKRPEKSHLHLSLTAIRRVSYVAKEYGKQFGVALADINKVDSIDKMNPDFYKIIRDDMKNNALVEKLLKTGKKVIVSTGLSTDRQIKAFLRKYKDYNNIVLNHTQLSYSVEDCNLKAIADLREKNNVPVSFGTHCSNPDILKMALCYEPSDILFYVKMDDGEYPDDKHAIQIKDVQELCLDLRNLSKAIGEGAKVKVKNKIPEMKL